MKLRSIPSTSSLARSKHPIKGSRHSYHRPYFLSYWPVTMTWRFAPPSTKGFEDCRSLTTATPAFWVAPGRVSHDVQLTFCISAFPFLRIMTSCFQNQCT